MTIGQFVMYIGIAGFIILVLATILGFIINRNEN